MILVSFFTDFSSPFGYLTHHYINKIREMYIPDLEITPKTFTLYEHETISFEQLLEKHLKVSHEEMLLYLNDIKLIFENENLIFNDNVIIANQTLAQIGLKFANDYQLGNHYTNLVYLAVFQNGYDISKEEVIIEILEDLELDIKLFKTRLDEDYYFNQIKQDLLLVENLEIKTVPFMLIENNFAVKTFYDYESLLTLILKIKSHLDL